MRLQTFFVTGKLNTVVGHVRSNTLFCWLVYPSKRRKRQRRMPAFGLNLYCKLFPPDKERNEQLYRHKSPLALSVQQCAWPAKAKYGSRSRAFGCSLLLTTYQLAIDPKIHV